MKSCLDSISYFLLGCNDQKGTENDEREPEAVLDKDIMKLVLVGVGQDQVDVVVWDVDGDQSGEEEEGTRRQSSGSAAWGEGKTDHPDDEGGDGTEDGGDVDGEVEGDLVQQIVWLADDWTEGDSEVCAGFVRLIIGTEGFILRKGFFISKKMFFLYRLAPSCWKT